jgi:hypothetical protein
MVLAKSNDPAFINEFALQLRAGVLRSLKLIPSRAIQKTKARDGARAFNRGDGGR